MIDATKCCLILIDVQEKLLRVMSDPQRVLKNCETLLQIAQACNIPVIWCQQNPNALGPTAPQLVRFLSNTTPVNKMSFSCCGSSDFNMYLEKTGTDTAILCGIESHVCVFQTAMDLSKRGLRVHVIADAIGSRTENNHQIALSRLIQNAIVISSTEMLLFELLRSAEHPKFKMLASLIK